MRPYKMQRGIMYTSAFWILHGPAEKWINLLLTSFINHSSWQRYNKQYYPFIMMHKNNNWSLLYLKNAPLTIPWLMSFTWWKSTPITSAVPRVLYIIQKYAQYTPPLTPTGESFMTVIHILDLNGINQTGLILIWCVCFK